MRPPYRCWRQTRTLLRENIRSRLLVAAQAVPRHQEETYKQALDNVSTWVRAYYDTEDATTKAFLRGCG